MASFRRALPSFDRCDLPRTAALRFSGLHPGRFAHGPEENSGRAGRMAGFGVVVTAMSPILADGLRPVGRAWPGAERTRIRRGGKKNLAAGAKSPRQAAVRGVSAARRFLDVTRVAMTIQAST